MQKLEFNPFHIPQWVKQVIWITDSTILFDVTSEKTDSSVNKSIDAVNTANLTLPATEMDSTVTSSLDDITPLNKELDFDFDDH